MKAAMAMHIDLPPKLEEFVRSKIDSGLYESASDVVREALHLLEKRDVSYLAKLSRLRQAVQAGIDSGPAVDWDPGDVKRAGRARRSARTELDG